jgi:4-hydroxy-3-methylbut-2-enyl diphosphate reductase
MGVRRAVALAIEEADRVKKDGGYVYTSGPLIHNPKVLADLKNCGVETYDRLPQDLKNCSVIIRAHGIAPRIENDLCGRGARVVDATCPKVKESQLKAKALAQAGYALFLAGDSNHAEIEGILGYISKRDNVVAVGSACEAENAAKKLYEAEKNGKNPQLPVAALIGQTTISEEEYSAIGEAIKKHFPNLEIVNTICSAARDRQQALRDLLAHCDAVIIAGGKDSSNTRRLLAIAKESGKPCALVETAAEIPPSFYACEKVGISAGASTPDSVIDEIERVLIE